MKAKGSLASRFRILHRLRRRRRPEVRIARAYSAWVERESQNVAVFDAPRISVLLPVYNTPEPYLRATIASVLAQSFGNWELCIADDASTHPHVGQVLAEMATESRLRVVRLPENDGIAMATNAALALASGKFVALLDHDDLLAPHALAAVAAEIAEHADAAIVFSDEDQLVEGVRCRPYFKPGWNPDLMLSQNLVSHLGVYRKTLIDAISGMRPAFEGSQDYDLALRATARVPAVQIRHIPKMLYHWRQHKNSFSAQRLDICASAARAALAEHVGNAARVAPNPDIPQWNRIVYNLPDPLPLVSLILPKGGDCLGDEGYSPLETVFGGAEGARGEVLVFLAGDLVPAREGWLQELVSQALRPEIGCVGPRLERPDGRVFNSGLTLHPEAIAHTLSPCSDHEDPGYLGHFLLARSVAAVASACLAVRRDVFEQAGGFDARAGAYADVDLCLRLAEQGLRCAWTPHARLRYRKLPHATEDLAGARYMRGRWGGMLASDPYSNPHLRVKKGKYVLF